MKKFFTSLLFVLCLVNLSIQADDLDGDIDKLFGGGDGDSSKPVTKKPDLFGGGYEEITQKPLEGFGAQDRCGEGEDKGIHLCVPYYKCDGDTNTIIPGEDENTDGAGLIDIRFKANACDNYLDVCCKIPEGGVPATTPRPVIPPEPTPGPDTDHTKNNFCGIRHENGIDFKITGNTHHEAEYGEFPWMTAILKKNYDPSKDETLAICGGAVLTPNVVITGAHCVQKFKTYDLKVRVGEWDTQTTRERIPYQERDIKNIILHDGFHAQTLYNDIALLVLDKPIAKAGNVGTICMPPQGMVFNSNNCFASGWGKDVFGQKGQFQVILKKRELPIVPRLKCQDALRKTRLGSLFKLHETFTCAGGEAGKDTCTGDGGSPLVCPDPIKPGRYLLAGLVAWGIGCGENNVPGVYADVPQFRDWVDKQMGQYRLDTRPYKI